MYPQAPGELPLPEEPNGTSTNENSTTTGDEINNRSYTTIITDIGISLTSSILSSLRWCPTSTDELAKAESDLLTVLKKPFKIYFVDIGPGWGERSNKIRTLEMLTEDETKNGCNTGMKTENKKIPLVLVHGFGAGIGTWILNLDSLASAIDRKIYAFDVIGFARSSRVSFDLRDDVEAQFVDSIERWRRAKGIEKFILLGHSFGGYLSAGYALKYPHRTPHVILADPWGFNGKMTSPNRETYRFPFWVRAVTSVFQALNPLAVLRASGPYGPRLVQKFRGDLREKFRPILQNDCYKYLIYVYHCNVQKATGETAFKSLALPYGWPKYPMLARLIDLDESVSLTFIYGSRSWVDKTPGEFLRDCMAPNRVTSQIIQGSGHHVYADKYAEFNEMVKEACMKVDY